MLRPALLASLITAATGIAHAEEAGDTAASDKDPLKIKAGAVLMTDYIYRGVSYSAHYPAVGSYVDVQYGWIYAWTNFNSVKFSTSPSVEITTAAGLRPSFGSFDFDIGWAYYTYPGEVGPERSNYWEAHATMEHKLADQVTIGSTLAYSPNIWQTGAWGGYAAGALSYDLPSELLPNGLGATLSGDLGRSWFGNTTSGGGISAAGGGLPLPAYTNWRAGITFSYQVFKLALNYTDTNLSRENCYVYTGDLAAIPGGIANPGNNPFGLRSGLCGATFSATLGFEVDPRGK